MELFPLILPSHTVNTRLNTSRQSPGSAKQTGVASRLRPYADQITLDCETGYIPQESSKERRQQNGCKVGRPIIPYSNS